MEILTFETLSLLECQWVCPLHQETSCFLSLLSAKPALRQTELMAGGDGLHYNSLLLFTFHVKAGIILVCVGQSHLKGKEGMDKQVNQ